MIRRASLADLDELLALERAFPEVDQFDRRTWRRLLGGQSRTLVHESASKIDAAAVVLFRQGAHTARLYSISVAPEARGQGLGGQLLAACEDEARAGAAVRMRLEVRASNSSALRLYAAAGYRVIAHLESYYPDGEAALRMQKNLTAPEGVP